MELPITTDRPYLSADLHHPLVGKNLLRLHGSPDSLLHAMPTIEGFNQLRGMVHFAGTCVLEQWDGMDEEFRGERPVIELVAPSSSNHCKLIARMFMDRFKFRQHLGIINPKIGLVLNESHAIANIDAGWLRKAPQDLTQNQRKAVERFHEGFAAWERGKRPAMPNVPGGTMRSRQHLVRVIEGENDLAKNHVGQLVLKILTTSALHADLAALEMGDTFTKRAILRGEAPYPYVPIPPHGAALIYRISQNPPERLTEEPLALAQPPTEIGWHGA